MALVPYTDKDFLSEAREDITQQFKDKEIIDRYLQVFLAELPNIQQMFKDLLQKRSIDEATGEQLDVIGRIVGQPRDLISLDLYKYFAFLGYPNGGGYGDLNDPSVGAPFYSAGTPTGGNYTLDDETYRLFIKSKILKNQTAATPEELITLVKFLFGQETPVYIREGKSKFTLFFGRGLSTLEKNLLGFISYELGYPSRLIPKPVGVAIEYAYFRGNRFFAFQGVPNAKGFGDKNAIISGWGEDYNNSFGGTASASELAGGYLASYLSI